LFFTLSISQSVTYNGVTYAKGYLGDLVCVRMCFDEANAWAPKAPPMNTAIDGVVLSTNAEDHTIGCVKLDNCLNGGWTLLVPNTGATGYEVGYIFDAASNLKVIDFVNSLVGADSDPVPQIGIVGYYSTLTSPPTFTIQTIRTATAETQETVEGYLGDWICVNMCFDEYNAWAPKSPPFNYGVDDIVLSTNAPDHTIGCLTIPACYQNGWTILVPDGAGYKVGYHFVSDVEVKAYIDTLVAVDDTTPSPRISVTGTVDNSYSPALITATTIAAAPSGAISLSAGLIGVVFVIFSLLFN